MLRRAGIWNLLVAVLLCLSTLMASGCRYATNRVDDLCDVFQLAGGVTTENPKGGVLPPSLGLHVQATEFINLGAVHFAGYSAEMDGRGFFAGQENRTRLGLGPLQALQIDQNYAKGSENYFKKSESEWCRRMAARSLRWHDTPAKELNYRFWADSMHVGWPVMHRGWQYWENCGVELAICEPFLTHVGLTFRVGFDPSEISDFVFGFFGVDFKEDDMTCNELNNKDETAKAMDAETAAEFNE